MISKYIELGNVMDIACAYPVCIFTDWPMGSSSIFAPLDVETIVAPGQAQPDIKRQIVEKLMTNEHTRKYFNSVFGEFDFEGLKRGLRKWAEEFAPELLTHS